MPQRWTLTLDISGPEMKKAILDRDHLERYTMGCPDLEAELIRLFLDQVPDLTRQLEGVVCDEDWKFATHTLKGSARAIGALMIADLAQGLEELGPNAADRERFETIVRLKAAVSAFRIEVGEVPG
jgi:HPt (histidine-containing phosphotransfer) domain-containing protein